MLPRFSIALSAALAVSLSFASANAAEITLTPPDSLNIDSLDVVEGVFRLIELSVFEPADACLLFSTSCGTELQGQFDPMLIEVLPEVVDRAAGVLTRPGKSGPPSVGSHGRRSLPDARSDPNPAQGLHL